MYLKTNARTTCANRMIIGTSLVDHWLRLQASTAGGPGLIPGWGAKILYAALWGWKKKEQLWFFSTISVALNLVCLAAKKKKKENVVFNTKFRLNTYPFDL